MLTKTDIKKLIDGCRETGKHGLGNGSSATIPELTVDFLTPPSDFLGIKSVSSPYHRVNAIIAI